MRIEWGRGYRRLALAIVATWGAMWITVGSFCAYQQGVVADMFVEASKNGRWREAAWASQSSREWGDCISASLMWGSLVAPMILLFLIAWWVLRGFFLKDHG